MTTFFAALAVFLVALAAMAVGVILSNRRIKGSCGGLNNFRDSVGNPVCDACTKPSADCDGDPRERGGALADGAGRG